jgi:hypothetical protein
MEYGRGLESFEPRMDVEQKGFQSGPGDVSGNFFGRDNVGWKDPSRGLFSGAFLGNDVTVFRRGAT